MTSSLRFELRLPAESAYSRSAEARRYDDELDDVGSILHGICVLFHQTPGAAFVVSGFGQDAWPASRDRELCLLLEQLPDIARALQRDESFEIAFFEQGCYRVLSFEARGDMLAVSCVSGDAWQPTRDEELMPAAELRAMLRDVLTRFLSFAESTSPDAVGHPWFERWALDIRTL